jgi:pectate lyase
MARKHGVRLLWLVLLSLSQATLYAAGPLPCFPGAEGFGTETPGGRGGRVIKVTNLDVGGPGSLQAACDAEGPRIVVFEVSGVIPGEVVIPHGRISILGQTAPGAGITVKGILRSGEEKSANLDDIVVRFLRVRPDSNKTLNDQGDGVRLFRGSRIVLDHLSVAWASDETIDVFQANDVTMQWCTIEDADSCGHFKGVHNFGFIQGPDGFRTSIHHNLFAHQKRRSPAVANGPADIRNNVVYNFRDGFLHDNETNGGVFNLIGNYYKRGPSDPRIFPFCFQDTTRYYLRDNFIEGVGLIQDPWAEKDKMEGLRFYAKFGRKATAEAVCPKVTTQPPREAYELVLERAGCFPRDFVTLRTAREVRNGTGHWGRRGIPDLMAGLTPAAPPKDSDSDGMPDEWERARGLDPADSADHGKVMPSGYTAIEEYCNELAEKIVGQGK